MKPKWEVFTQEGKGNWGVATDRFVTLKCGLDEVTFHSYKGGGVHTASIFTRDNRFELGLPFEEFRAIFEDEGIFLGLADAIVFDFFPGSPGKLVINSWSKPKNGPEVENTLVWHVPTNVLKKFRKEIKELLK